MKNNSSLKIKIILEMMVVFMMISASMFGVSASGPGYENSDGQDNLFSDYICEKVELMIDHPEFGKLLYNRVEKILPTPVPTGSP